MCKKERKREGEGERRRQKILKGEKKEYIEEAMKKNREKTDGEMFNYIFLSLTNNS